jgi:hypothetical protein
VRAKRTIPTTVIVSPSRAKIEDGAERETAAGRITPAPNYSVSEGLAKQVGLG